jgi:hypothetical protein
MSEVSVNNGEATSAPSTHTVTVEHALPQSSESGKTAAAHRDSNHDRLEKAYSAATSGGKLTNDVAAPLTVDRLADINGIPEGNFTGVDYNKTISELPDDAKKILANLRSDYTKKTTEIAAQRRELDAQREAMLSSQAMRDLQAKASETPVDADPWDATSFNNRIEQEVAKRLNEVLKPMQEERASQQRRQKLAQFKSENPDIETYKTEIVEVLKSNEALSLEQAYYFVKGKNQTDAMRKQEQELAAYKSAAKDYGLKVSVGSVNSGPLKPPASVKRDAYSIYKWMMANQKA